MTPECVLLWKQYQSCSNVPFSKMVLVRQPPIYDTYGHLRPDAKNETIVPCVTTLSSARWRARPWSPWSAAHSMVELAR